MIILNATTDKIQAVLAGNITANQLQCMATWRDITTTEFTPGRTLINTNNTTDVDVVGSPAASTQRVVDYISVYQADTVNATVTVKFDANGTEYILFKALIGTGEKIEYTNEGGWKVLTNVGSVKTSVNQGAAPASVTRSMTVLTADVGNNNASLNTMEDITGLSFAVTTGNTYWFRFAIIHQVAATTTGARYAINGPSASLLCYRSDFPSAASGTDSVQQISAVAYDIPAAVNTASGATTVVVIIEGFITPSENGTVIARHASELANTAITAKAGSMVEYQLVVAA